MITEEQKQKFYQFGADNNKYLEIAAKEGDLELIKYLVNTDFGSSFKNITTSGKQSAFVVASGTGHLDVMKYLLKRASKKSNFLKFTAPQALRQAIQEGQIESAEYLLHTFEIKKHLDVAANTEFYFKLAPLNMLEYLVFEYKMDLSSHIKRLRKDPYVIKDKPYASKVLDYYELQSEIGINNNISKEKKLKI